MPSKPQVPGLVKGLGVTFNTMMQTIKPKKFGGGAATVQYPREKEAPTARARGVIALREDNCTSCMLCARSCAGPRLPEPNDHSRNALRPRRWQ